MKSETIYTPNFIEKSIFLGQIFFAKYLFDKSLISEGSFVNIISAGGNSREGGIFSFIILPLICLILGISAIAE
ncbi:MAG: hypothetical protein ACXACU_05260, partial [Candidatus Hodarchaeales archaeon]